MFTPINDTDLNAISGDGFRIKSNFRFEPYTLTEDYTINKGTAMEKTWPAGTETAILFCDPKVVGGM